VAGRWLPHLVRDLVLHNMASSTTSMWDVLYRHDLRRAEAAALPPDLP